MSSLSLIIIAALYLSLVVRYISYHTGNSWAVIASRLGTKDQNSIKNKFYSTLRKGLRKINKYITDIKKKADPVRYKSFKTIQEIFISKLIAVVDRNYDEKYEVRSLAVERAAGIHCEII